jgi:hypothetical protein
VVAGLIQEKLRVRGSILLPAPIEKQSLTETGPLDGLQELLGDDLVRIDIDAVERSDDPGHFRERLHQISGE